MRRRGTLYLVVVLPDGSRSMVPAEWTDLDPSSREEAQKSNPVQQETLGSVPELMQTRLVVDALLRRLANTQPAKEVERATDIRVSDRNPVEVGKPRRSRADRIHGEARTGNRKGSVSRSGKGGE